MSVAEQVSPRRPAGSLAVTAVGVVGFALLARGVGLISQVVTSAVLGASARADTYYFAVTIVTMVSSLVFSTVPLVFIPHYMHIHNAEGQETADRFASGVVTYLFLALAGLALAVAVLAWPLVGWIGRFSPETRTLAARVFATTAPLIFLMGVAQLLMMLFHARKRFTWPACVGIVNGIVFTGIVVLGWKRLDIYALVLGTLAGAAAQGVFLYAAIRREIALRPSLAVRREDIFELLGLAWPLFVGQATTLIWVAVTRSIASGLPAGSLAALSYADGLKAVFLSTVAAPVAAMVLPIFSEKIAQDNSHLAWEDLQRSLSALWYVTAPIVVGLVVLGEPLVRILYQRGAFDPRATHLTASALAFYSVGLFGETGNYLVARYYMAMKDTRTLAWIALPLTAFHCLLAWGFSRVLLANGVALAYSLFMIGSLGTTFLVLKRKTGLPFSRAFVRGTLKVMISGTVTLAMGLVFRKVMAGPSQMRFIDSLGFVAGAGAILAATYLVCSSLSRISRDVPLVARFHPIHLLRARTYSAFIDPRDP